MKRSPKLLKRILRGDTNTRLLIQQAREDAMHLEKIRQLLPPDIGHHCTGVHQRGLTFILYADSSAWASRIRFAAQTITQQTGARQVVVRVAPPTGPQNTRKPVPPRRSAAAAAFLEQSAESTSDQQIQGCLRRIARAIRREK